MSDKYAGHTPGPWKIGMGSTHVLAVRSGGICKMESIHGMYQDHKANAILIADAPKLLAQRDRLLEIVKDFLSIANESEGIAGWHLNGDLLKWPQVEQIQDMEDAIAEIEKDG